MSVYDAFALSLLEDRLAGATVKALLASTDYAPGGEVFLADLPSGSEISGGTYPAGGLTASAVTVAMVGANVVATCGDLTFAGLDSDDVGGAIFYLWTGDPATSELLAFHDFGPLDAGGGTTFTYRVSTAGFLRLSPVI